VADIENCKTIEVLFAPFIDGTLGEEEMRAVRNHLETCPDCLARLALARQALTLLRRLQEEDVALPEGFQDRLMQRIMTGDLAMDALDFSWHGLLATLLSLLEAIFDMLAGPQPEGVAQPA
jgi:anti-sigma factor RsiW